MPESLPLIVVAEDFEAFYKRQYPKAVGLAYALAGKRHLAEEIAQEAFIAGYRRWDRIATYDSPEAWLRRVIVNKSTSVLRRGLTEVKALPRLRAGLDTFPPIEPEAGDYGRRFGRCHVAKPRQWRSSTSRTFLSSRLG